MQKLFGRKKESIMDPNQVNLFDDQLFSYPEQTGEQSDEEVIIEKHSRRKKKKRFERTSIKKSTYGRSYS